MRRVQDMDRARGYRRGTVMGLTVAEAFMLIAFVLLMLLGVWMATARERIEALEARVAAAEPFAGAFTEVQKAAAIAGREQLTLLGNDLTKLDAFRTLAAAGASPSEAALALAMLPAVRDGLTPDEVLDRARLLDEAALRDLAQAAAALSPEDRAVLTDLARLQDFPEVAALLRERALPMLAADLADGAPDADDALAAYRATGLDPAEIVALAAQMDDAARARLRLAASRAEIAAALRDRTGPLVAALGGEIGADGSIVFRDRTLFDAGSAIIRPQFDTTLGQLCRPWFETLHARRDDLSAVRIEGHASSEWTQLPARAAFDRNLDLSQARAAAVFKRCLAYAGDDAVADWARTRMTAVGYSSSRPVLSGEGVEDAAASRRVVFAIDMDANAGALAAVGADPALR